jgi:tetratricopeptide (TPR) repeat protein
MIPSLVLALALGSSVDLQALIDAGHFKRARAVAVPRFESNPKDAEAAYVLSAVKEAYGQDEEAERLAETAVALDPSSPRYHYQLGAVLGTRGEKAGIFKKLGFARRFRSETERALALEPNYLDAKIAMLEFFLQAPSIMGGDHAKAEAIAKEIGTSDPAAGFRAQMRIAREDKDLHREEQAGLDALKANPRDYEAAVSLADFYWVSHRNQEAETFARRAIESDATRAIGYVLEVQALARQGRLADLDPALEEAERNVPDDLSPYYQAGREILLAASDLPRAEKYFRKFLSEEPEGERPDLPHAHWRLALVLEKEGRKAEAIAELKAALALKPDLPEAKKDLARLE